MTTDIALFGPPGAGKGTQAKPLAAERELVYIATDELVLGLLVEAIERQTAARGFVFDGFPRTTAQAEALDDELDGLGRPPLRAILIDVPDEVLIERLSGRRICTQRPRRFHPRATRRPNPRRCGSGSPAITSRQSR